MLPIKYLIWSRQLNYFRTFKKSLKENSVRKNLFEELIERPTPFLKHYIDLDTKYEEGINVVKENIIKINNEDSNYKFWIYMKMNPCLKPSPFLMMPGSIALGCIKFRVGSHNLPIEKGRWYRKPRDERLCSTCGILGNEIHYLFDCPLVCREGMNLSILDLETIWSNPNVYEITKQLCDGDYYSHHIVTT